MAKTNFEKKWLKIKKTYKGVIDFEKDMDELKEYHLEHVGESLKNYEGLLNKYSILISSFKTILNTINITHEQMKGLINGRKKI